MKNKLILIASAILTLIAVSFDFEVFAISLYVSGYILSLIALFKLTFWICAVRNVRGVDRDLTYREFVKSIIPIMLKALLWPFNIKVHCKILAADCNKLYFWFH